MGINERRERERKAVRKKILEAARELFVAEGYDAVTMRRIAEAIEYSPTAIYFHFKDKETLIRELCKEDSSSLAKAFNAIAKEPDALERLRKIGRAYVEFGVSHPNSYRLMFMTQSKIKEDDYAEMGHGKQEEDGYAFLVATVIEAIDKGLLRKVLVDPHLVAQAIWSAGHGVVALHLAKRDDPWVEWRSLTETAELIMHTMINGLKREGIAHD
jgi:AcrR family transcriptional regulator